MRTAVAVAFVALATTAVAGPEIALPKTKNGMLSPGEADKLVSRTGKPVTNVVDVGAKPLVELSYALAKGSKRKLAMTLEMTMKLELAGKNTSVTSPPVTMVMECAVVDKNTAGHFQIDAKVIDAAVDATDRSNPMVPMLRDAIPKMKGLRIVYWMDPKGYVHDAKIEAPPDLPPMMQQMAGNMSQSIQQLAFPLPYEAVGTGARWQAFTRTSSSGMDVVQAATFTLRSRTSTTATLDVDVRQLAASDTITANGTSVKLRSLESKGAGSVEVDLASHLPNSGKMTIGMMMDLDAGSPMRMAMTMTLTLKRP